MTLPEIDALPAAKRELLRAAVVALASVEGVAAIVLAGSYARGTAHTGSDLDVGVYYSEVKPLDVADIRRVAERLSDRGTPVVTGFYEWGPWVNGGAWIQTAAGKLDFLYRSIEHVERTIDEAERGITKRDYDQQPTFGFSSVIYLAETQQCIALADPAGVIARLKERVVTYPSALRQAIINGALWGAEFTLLFARKFAAAGDVYNTAGCLTRIAAHLTQALYALNATYFISDKGALDAIDRFALTPPRYAARVTDLLAQPGDTAPRLVRTVSAIQALWDETVRLAGNDYRARYPLDG
jgi:predicted nucleotidyltransferase